jgi:mannose/cellobiose epimerase-like protein (N-acyl-D-glucosamine 2-epimerase family)
VLWLDNPAHARWLEHHTDGLLAFGPHAAAAPGGSPWLDVNGEPDRTKPVELWITSRMTHVYALGAALGRPGCAEIVDHGIRAMSTAFADRTYGGWYASVTWDGEGLDVTKQAYAHAFVILAASSATVVGRPGATELLRSALAVAEQHFWDDEAGMSVEGWDAAFTMPDPYRGANANMHTVEAYLAAADVTGDAIWRERAVRILTRIIDVEARAAEWRVPEHFDAAWHQVPDYNASRPDDRFRPFGATPGHGMEWSRLLLEARAALHDDAPTWMLDAAIGLFDRAVADGWFEGGQPGFCYTTDFDGNAVVRARLHWVLAEALGAAATAYRATGESTYATWYETWWEYAARYVIDRERGSWHHELTPEGEPSFTMWPGKPDIYHAIQATLIPRLPLTPTLVPALARGLLDVR